jgi:bifunctional DNA-binding transcriptional regulator/antitoxin component of YhaV-PrlF toxin-antitoxin module
MEVETKVWKGNSRGVGFAIIPKELENYFAHNENVKVDLNDSSFFTKTNVHKNRSGIYIPKEICSGLMGKKVKIMIEKMDGFYSTLGEDGRLYIPNHIIRKFGIDIDDIVLIAGKLDGFKIEKICIVKKRERGNKKEYRVIFDSNFSGKPGIFELKRKLSRNVICPVLIKNSISNFKYAQIDENSMILFHGGMAPIVINTDIKISDISYYFGMYFSDGTKKGFSWAINSSTFEQGKYNIKMHKKIIKNQEFTPHVTITTNKKDGNYEDFILKKWNDEIGNGFFCKKIIVKNTKTKDAPNRNEYGSLTIREGGEIIVLYYNKLMNNIIETIKNGDFNAGIDFLCGILEGDGCANSKKRGHISIATNEYDKNIIESVIKSLKIEFNIYKEGENKYTVRIGALEILKKLPIMKDKLFRYYPKRRTKFINRFHNVGAVKFILGEQKHAPGWVKSYLKNNNILDENYMLTDYGKNVRKCLRNMIKEVERKETI